MLSMSMAKDDLEHAFEALAAVEGRSVEDLKRDLLRNRLRSHTNDRGDALARVAPSGRLARSREREPDFPGTPVVRPAYDDDDDETPTEAQERWYREEQSLVDGVHGWGGQSAGGIFGNSPIATEEYDPEAEMRAEHRTATHAQAQQAVAVTQLTQAVGMLMDRLGVPQSGNILPGVGRRQLGRGRRR